MVVPMGKPLAWRTQPLAPQPQTRDLATQGTQPFASSRPSWQWAMADIGASSKAQAEAIAAFACEEGAAVATPLAESDENAPSTIGDRT